MFAKMVCVAPDGTSKEVVQKFNSKEHCLGWLGNKRLDIARSIKLLDKTDDWLVLEMPISKEIIVVFGEPGEIPWLHVELLRRRMYTTAGGSLPGKKYVRTMPSTGTTMFPVSLTMTPEQKERGVQIATSLGLTFSQFMRDLLDNYEE